MAVEAHLRDGVLDPLALVGADGEEPEPVGDDLVHRRLLVLLLGRLVVVCTDHEWDLEVQHLVGEVTHRQHAENVVDVLHPTDRVTARVEAAHHRTERFDPDQHPRISGVAVGSAQGDDVAVLLPLEGGSDDPDRQVVGRRIEHGLEVGARELRFHRNVQDEAELVPRPDVRHQHRLQGDVEGVRPRVPFVHLDELHVAALEEAREEPTGRTLVTGGVGHDDHPADAGVAEVPDLLLDVFVVERTNDGRRSGELVTHDACSF